MGIQQSGKATFAGEATAAMGEAGRGFAAVASEVRSLAQRSADTAREIKRLINVSVKRVCDRVADISAAATEQSQGIVREKDTVVQLDQVTQQNAARVEQTAAAVFQVR